MYILGINAYHGDASAVLLKDGVLVAAVEEERFRRVKHWAGFPTESIRSVLRMGGITGAQIDHVAISRDPKANLLKKGMYALSKRPDFKMLFDRAKNAAKVRDVDAPLAEALGIDAKAMPKVHFVEHHPTHLASTFFVSPFEDAAVCAIDGFGDFVSTSLAVGKGNQLEVLEKVYFPHSLGLMYQAVTQYLGFMGYGDEFKVMGLAPYGKTTMVDELRKLVILKPDGLFELDLSYFRHWDEGVEMEWDGGYPTVGRVYSDKLIELLGPARDPKAPLTSRDEDIARSLQAVYEEASFHVLNGLYARTKNPRLCMAGGCAMNSVANGKIRDNTPFTDVYIQPASGDNGTALGAAYWVWNQELKQPRGFVMEHGYWGPEHDEAPVHAVLRARNDAEWTYEVQKFATSDETATATARLIAEGNVVGWYQGRMEWGSRALGNRSIVADPRRADMRDLINLKIKFREKFRPFAPSVAAESVADYFEGAVHDPFMVQVYPVKPDKREGLPAITHVDGSGRLQSVKPTTNATYYKLIKEFEKLSGVPIVLNTSFNENEPIVETPVQALDCFLRTRMDVIVLNNTLIRRVPVGKEG